MKLPAHLNPPRCYSLWRNGGGALTPGRYVQPGSKPMTNLFLSLAEKMGAQNMGNFGDSTGKLGDV
ncbi:MAG: hypothetical protein HY043_23410 [Verrucomicrobia bacterium]|nr:hypothetical protein [Verrucomicrobiota bacterium]